MYRNQGKPTTNNNNNNNVIIIIIIIVIIIIILITIINVCSMLTNDGRCTCELNPVLLSQNLNLTKKGSFYWQNGLCIEEETRKMLHLECSFIWC
jgi:hypothetical protein